MLLVVDQRSPMFFGSRRAMKSVAAAEVTALATWRTLQVGDRVGGIIFGDDEIIDLRPQRSQTAGLRLLHEVARLNQSLAKGDGNRVTTTLNQALAAAARRANHDHLVVVISDLDGADEETERLATRIAAHNDVIVAAIYDPLGATLQSRPGMVAATPAGQLSLPAGGAFQASFRQAFDAVLDRWYTIFRSLRVPILPISTAEPPAQQLRELFGQHLKP